MHQYKRHWNLNLENNDRPASNAPALKALVVDINKYAVT